MSLLDFFKPSEAEILENKKAGRIYVADFGNGEGKYVDISEYSAGSDGSVPDLDVKISSKINLRVTYVNNGEKITGVQIAKVNGTKIEKIHFSTLDFEKILELLKLFSELDLKSIANKSLILDESIIQNPEEVTNFLNLVAADPSGKEKLKEVVINYDLIEKGDLDNIVQKRRAVELFEKILNSNEEFSRYKLERGVGKDEEVWQRLFSENHWILGSDFVEVLDERRIDVDNITDYLLKSYDGFVDIVELKLPTAEFWTTECIPTAPLTKATMQCGRYILETERRINDLELHKKINHTPIAKPRITLIYGRSKEWGGDQREAYRVLNSGYSSMNIMTYDHLLERAKRLVGLSLVPNREEESEQAHDSETSSQ